MSFVQTDLVKIRQGITTHFTLGELKTLCFDLSVNYDNLPGETLMDKVRELILYLDRDDRLTDLLERCQQLRPNVSWPSRLGRAWRRIRRKEVLHNLPRREFDRFVGRQDELQKVQRLLSPAERAWVIVIDGIGGIGKSALALEVAHRYLESQGELPEEARFEAIVWTSAKTTVLTADKIETRHQISRTLEDIFATIALTLEREDIKRASFSEQAAMIQKALTQQRTLLIIDNLETIDDERVNAFLRELPPPTKAIVTTRHRIDVAFPLRLAGMPLADGQALIEQECVRREVTLTAEETQALYDRTGGVPLAIVWSVALMGYGYSVTAVLRRLGHETSNIALFCFQEAVQQIEGQDAYDLLLTLSLFAGSAPRAALGVVAGLGDDEFGRDDGLVKLENLSLLNKDGDRFSLLPLTRTYTQDLVEKRPFFGQEASGRLLDFYKEQVTPELLDDVGDLYWAGMLARDRLRFGQEDWDNLAGVMSWALENGRPADGLHIFLSITHLLNSWGHWDERLAFGHRMCKVANGLGDPAETWLWIDAIGWIQRQRHQFDHYLRSLKRGRELARQYGLTDALILADVGEANIHLENARLDAAQTRLNQALEQIDLATVVQHERPVHRIVATRVMGLGADIYGARGDFSQAEYFNQQELALRKSTGEPVSPPLYRFGLQHLKRGQLEDAERYLLKAWVGAGQKDEAWINHGLALVAEARRDLDEARHLCRLASTQFNELGLLAGISEVQLLRARLNEQ